MARFYRIVQEHWAATALDGEGARRFGGRWNFPGLPAVYLAESRALAALEILVHAPREALLLEWIVIELDIPDDWIEKVPVSRLPERWRERPSSQDAQIFGSEWLSGGKKVALRLPSVVVPQEFSMLLNPLHADMRKIKVGPPVPFSFDERLADRA